MRALPLPSLNLLHYWDPDDHNKAHEKFSCYCRSSGSFNGFPCSLGNNVHMDTLIKYILSGTVNVDCILQVLQAVQVFCRWDTDSLTVMYSVVTKSTQPALCGNSRGGDIKMRFKHAALEETALPAISFANEMKYVRQFDFVNFPITTFPSASNLHFVYTPSDKTWDLHPEGRMEDSLPWYNNLIEH